MKFVAVNKNAESATTSTDTYASYTNNEMCPNFMFFISLLPSYEKISAVQQRKFKEIVLKTLHQYFDKQEEQVIETRTNDVSVS